jgi:hypothetical protein
MVHSPKCPNAPALGEPEPQPDEGEIPVRRDNGNEAGTTVDEEVAVEAFTRCDRYLEETAGDEGEGGLLGCNDADAIAALTQVVRDRINGDPKIDAEDKAVLHGRWNTYSAVRQRDLARGGRRR